MDGAMIRLLLLLAAAFGAVAVYLSRRNWAVRAHPAWWQTDPFIEPYGDA